jgi:hypothetical protein
MKRGRRASASPMSADGVRRSARATYERVVVLVKRSLANFAFPFQLPLRNKEHPPRLLVLEERPTPCTSLNLYFTAKESEGGGRESGREHFGSYEKGGEKTRSFWEACGGGRAVESR